MNTLAEMIVPVAWAASGGEAHSSSITDLFFPLVNFLIFAYLAKRYALPPIKEHLKKRRQSILNRVADANETRSRAEQYLQQYQQLVGNLAAESDKIRAGLKAEGEREKARIISEAEELAVKLKADADFMAAQDMKMARQQIRGELANLAEEAAARVIGSQLTDRDQERLIDNFAEHLRNT
jgi:F-type H+-transporting ATPase subunit b